MARGVLKIVLLRSKKSDRDFIANFILNRPAVLFRFMTSGDEVKKSSGRFEKSG